MMTTVMTTTALRREVCALFSLALLCCCASIFVTAATATGAAVQSTDLYSGASAVNVSVEISCADSENKLQWRFPGQTNWTRCVSSLGAYDYTVVASSGGYEDTAVVSSGGYDTVVQEITEYSVGTPSDIIEVVLLDSASGASSRDEESLCLSADRMYLTKKCNASCKSAGEGKTAFTMEFQTTNESGVYKKSLKNKTENNAPAGSTSGICPLNTSVEKAPESVNSGTPEAAAAASAAQVPAVGAPAAGQDAGSSSSAASGASSSAQTIEQGISSAGPQPGNTSQPPTGEGVGRTDASGTTQTPSATAGAASQSGNPTYTRETNNSAATGAQGPGTSDGSAIATAWVHTPLLLLLTALASAAGQRCGAATHE
ncbi:mucin-like glycoprotein, putative [Trypanosoma cruzi]|uniref:Mucin-like glycoprotein, putative n=1 Tax=Trypanosoma cruzi (strain CL Brener) TaxID=353153 RepID=Q4DLQ1_TRYCC|nr:mucin-like glycoprotein, putative [Trypanosoma cruzi]EAN93457.1 mucin-like glycoprotein, putative [Trypanosoma cruzi]|eukprot:XP_815308.1 mucin-like glycoprotein [Trypanosoma cruzi strain CL Brener]